MFHDLDTLLHRVWGKAVHTPGYDKREWMLFQEQIEQLKQQVRSLTLLIRSLLPQRVD